MDHNSGRALQLARELSDTIVASKAYEAREVAYANIEKNTAKLALLKEYSHLADRLQFSRLKGVAPTFDEEASLSLLYSKLCLAPDCRAFLEAQAQLDDLFRNVYEILNSSIKYP